MIDQDTNVTSLTTPSETEVLIRRTFDAPRDLVWEVVTTPENVRQWWGLRTSTMTVCEIDFRPGGAWRYVVREPDGNEFAFSGVYREIEPPERVVATEGWEAMPGHEYVTTTTLEEHDGKTTLTAHLQYQSKADRDGHLGSGMEWGMRQTHDRLAELLAVKTA